MSNRGFKKIVLLLFAYTGVTLSQSWSFSSVADPRGGFADFRRALTEIKKLTANPEPKIQKSEFVLVNGDFDPAEINFKIFNEVFSPSSDSSSLLLPVIGNHDLDYAFFIHEKMFKNQPLFNKYGDSSFSYYMDMKNARI
ncbi:MAG: hypothetical protein WC061_07820, partial [Melioribacteraceae bacterium]